MKTVESASSESSNSTEFERYTRSEHHAPAPQLSFIDALNNASKATKDQIYGTTNDKSVIPGGGDLA